MAELKKVMSYLKRVRFIKACVAEVIEPQYVTSAKQLGKNICSLPLMDFTNYRRSVLTGKATMAFLTGPISTQGSSAHVGETDQSSGEPWSKIVSDWFQRKTKKVFLIGPFKFARERLNVQRVWRVSRFFPRNVEVNTTGRFLISSIPEQRLHDQLGRITGFSNKIFK